MTLKIMENIGGGIQHSHNPKNNLHTNTGGDFSLCVDSFSSPLGVGQAQSEWGNGGSL